MIEDRPTGVISAVEPDPRRAGAVRVLVAGAPYCTIAAGVARAEGLVPGRPIDEALHERLGHAADVEAAYRTALRSLETRGFARHDLGRRLVRKGHPRPAVEVALERLAGHALLDDAAYAATYVETRSARGRGPLRLTRDLMAMGVERALIDAAIAAHWPEDADRTAMPLALATRRAEQMRDLPRPTKRRRLLAYLARRGFGGRDASDIVAKVVG